LCPGRQCSEGQSQAEQNPSHVGSDLIDDHAIIIPKTRA
jgi:hypothetical protein